MTLRANVLAKGYSGVRVCLIDTVIDMINKGVVPHIQEKGSLGTSAATCRPCRNSPRSRSAKAARSTKAS